MKCNFKIKGLDCANCAAELERAIQKVDGVDTATINFMGEKMVLEINEDDKEDVMKNWEIDRTFEPEDVMKKVKKVIKKEEPDVTLEEI